MAAVFSVTTETEEAVAAATAETLVQLRGHASTKAKICEWGVSFDGTSGTADPVRVRLLRQTSDGTGTGANEVKWDPDSPTALVTSFNTFSSTEPTAGDVLAEYQVHPQSGMVVQYPLGREPVMGAATTSRIAIDVLSPGAINASAYIVWEE